MQILHLDDETRSALPLKPAGLFNYAIHPTTEINLLSFARDDDEPELWEPGSPIPADVADHIEEGKPVWAHNALFEREIQNHVLVKHGWPELRTEQLTCTLALCLAMGLPGKLKHAAPALGLKVEKDRQGEAIMLELAQPWGYRADGSPLFWTVEDLPADKLPMYFEKRRRLGEYCKQDVRVERAIGKRVFALSEKERRIFQLDADINTRGVGIDVPAVVAAMELVKVEQERLDGEMSKLTGGAVGTCQSSVALTRWLQTQGVSATSVAKAELGDLLEDPELPETARAALELREEGGKSSVGKLKAMLLAVAPDGRARGLLQYHGAHPGRWAGRRIQPHNMPRPRDAITQENINDVLDRLPRREPDLLEYVRLLYGSPMQMLSDCLRGFIVAAPGHSFVGVDFTSIEARGLAWLAGQDDKLERFRQGVDAYKYMASQVYGVPVEEVTKPQRQVGKVGELACGYQGGEKAILKFERDNRLHLTREQRIQIRDTFRDSHPRIVRYWHELERAAITATKHAGQQCKAGAPGREVTFLRRRAKDGRAESFLWCRIPGGRVICYPSPEIQKKPTPSGGEADALFYKTMQNQRWVLDDTYGGKLSQNVTEGICAELLRDAMIRLTDARYPIVLTIHDEILLELLKRLIDLDHIRQLMTIVPEWAFALPITASIFVGDRYQK